MVHHMSMWRLLKAFEKVRSPDFNLLTKLSLKQRKEYQIEFIQVFSNIKLPN